MFEVVQLLPLFHLMYIHLRRHPHSDVHLDQYILEDYSDSMHNDSGIVDYTDQEQ